MLILCYNYIDIAYNKTGDGNMATKSFLKNISIKNKSSVANFIDALENAEGKKKKTVKYDKAVENVKEEEKIKKIFKR